MNERIKELAMQTDIWCDQNVAQGSPMYNNQWEQKFAELIVGECCAIADEVERADMDSYVSKYIRAHFGVE